jgi:hypothetical protein
MDERVEKAFQTANFMATLTSQRRLSFEEFQQNSIFYINGATFTIGPSLISFIKALIDLEKTTNVVLLDDNNVPVMIADLNEFLTEVLAQYLKASAEYFDTYSEIKSKRKIGDLVSL